jgi:hypothetical protein
MLLMRIKMSPRSWQSKYISTCQQSPHHHPRHVCQSLSKLDSPGFHMVTIWSQNSASQFNVNFWKFAESSVNEQGWYLLNMIQLYYIVNTIRSVACSIQYNYNTIQQKMYCICIWTALIKGRFLLIVSQNLDTLRHQPTLIFDMDVQDHRWYTDRVLIVEV